MSHGFSGPERDTCDCVVRGEALDAQAVIQAAARMLLEPVLRLLEVDPHRFSERPCPTCESVTAIAGRPFGCAAKAKAKRC